MAWEFDRRALLGTAGIGAVAWMALRAAPGEANARFAVAHTPAEWRKLLGPQRYRVLREAGTEPPFPSPLNKEHRRGIFACAGCGLPLFSSSDQVRQRHRLAELLPALAEVGGHENRPQPAHGTDRSALPAMRRASRPCVRRRPEADRPALLHERARLEVPTGLIAQQC